MAALTGTESQAEFADLHDWRADQPIKHQGDGRVVLATRFDDWPRYHDALIAAIIGQSQDSGFARRYVAAFGGMKVESPERWQIPAVDLVCRRAMAFCAAALNAPAPRSFESWVNIYGHGDYAIAHSHPAATVSLLYVVDPGDEELSHDRSSETDPLAGQFAIVDPRYPSCCRNQDGYVTNPVMPKLYPGLMLLFPGWLVHAVNPHRGTRPRITMTWNIRLDSAVAAALPEGAARQLR
ncbi:MAG: putative 2OG-Fe(II) oxygenase [Rhodospirillaceae bacterium]|nr:putative 2OG-Fe(II) oxygenase [Rhodospirillaceae bacterium]